MPAKAALRAFVFTANSNGLTRCSKNLGHDRLVPGFPQVAAGKFEPMPPASKTSPSEERSAADFLPGRISLKSLRDAAAGCRGCDLYKYATQTVFGEGPVRARLMLVGEEPGDSEDLEGPLFVGPAGKLLHRAMGAAGIGPRDAYV